jgi:nitrate/nitrite-specific signal transduction histidine kinase
MNKKTNSLIDNDNLLEIISMGFDTLTEHDLTRLLEKTGSSLKKLLDCQYVAIGLLDRGVYLNFLTAGISKDTVKRIGDIPRGIGLLGEIIEDGEVMNIPVIKQHDNFTGYPKHHPTMDNLLAKSISNKDEVLGRVYAANKKGGFTKEDESMIEVVSRLIAQSILHVRMNEIVKSNEIQLKIESIKRDLHDSALQNLVALNMQLQLLAAGNNNKEIVSILESTKEVSEKVVSDLYRLVDSSENVQARVETLEQQILDIVYRAETTSNIKFDVKCKLNKNLDSEIILAVTTIVQEAVSNIVKHSEATKATIKVKQGDKHIDIAIEDNGKGFDEESMGRGFGLKNIQIRAIELSGEAKFRSSKGTKIKVHIKTE